MDGQCCCWGRQKVDEKERNHIDRRHSLEKKKEKKNTRRGEFPILFFAGVGERSVCAPGPVLYIFFSSSFSFFFFFFFFFSCCCCYGVVEREKTRLDSTYI